MSGPTGRDLFKPNTVKPQAQLTEKQLIEKDKEFIIIHQRFIQKIRSTANGRVFCLKGLVKQDSKFFNLGDSVWYICPADDVKGYKAFFIAGKTKAKKWENIKFVATYPGILEFNYIDVPEGFANDRGLYKLTKDQIIQNIQNSINLRKQSLERRLSTKH